RGAPPLPVVRPGPRRRRRPRLSRPPVLPALGVLVALVLAACVGWSTAGGQAVGSHAGQDAAQVPAADAGPGAHLAAPSDAVALADQSRPTAGAHPGRAAPTAGRPRRDDLSRWRALLTELDGARARAFERGEESALGDADVPGSSAYAIDAALLRSVLARGARVAGLHQRIESVRLLRTGSVLVVVRTVDRLLPYAFVDTHGRVLARIPGKQPRMHDVAVVRTAAGWRVAQVSHVPGTGR
ncbi:MAG TPA: hypothetical protein VKP11_06585, partial [Frankiaceae bacterium]|nr:hypothetical protein [Frankiaceae bacterium]